MDSRPFHLCPVCLLKLWHTFGFDIVARYTAIMKAWAIAGLPNDEIEWLQKEITRITTTNL